MSEWLRQLSTNHAPGPHHEAPAPLPAGTQAPARLIAYYLPQFHPIPENDAWWGTGFTEWTNVTRALPRFAGHYQPHLPAELGFYDLRLPQVLHRQAELARAHGIEGFCFHHYWFAGRTLLDGPIQLLLDHPEIDIGFCVNWANENWTRRWDGNDSEILMAQKHSAEDDIAFAISLEPLFRDPRYIRIDGRPLLMLYRPRLLPDPAATVRRWRAHFQAAGLGNPYIVMPRISGTDDPREYGMDAAAGFPPHGNGFNATPVQDTQEMLSPGYQGTVVRYDEMVELALADDPDRFTYFPGVCPAWDNEARKPNRGFSIIGSSPAAYGAWLDATCRRAMRAPNPQEHIVFINAWNEWAEGAHLEPDRHHGYAYLNETARVVARLGGLAPEALRQAVAAEAPPPRPRRRLADLPGLVAKNLAYHGANAAERLAKALRRLV